jgi:iron(III) transport system permease protein
MLIVGLGLLLIEPAEEDAALLEGSLATVLCRVTLPRACPSIVVAAVWILVMTGTDMTVTDLYQIRTFAEEIYLDVPDMGRISSLEPLRPTVLTQVIFVSCWTVLALVLTSKLAPPEHIPSYSTRRVYRLGVGRWVALAFVAMTLVVLIGVPLGNLIYKAGLTVEQMGAERVRHWSVGAIAEILLDSPGRFAEEYKWSFVISALAAVAAVVVAASLAWLARRGTWRALPALVTSAVCLGVPGPTIGLSVIWLLHRESSPVLSYLYDYSIFAPWLAMLIKCLPITIFVSWYALRTVSDEVVEAAASEGANWFVQFWRIGVLQHRLTLAGAALAAFVIAFGDLAASILVIPPGVSTIPVRVFGLLHSGVDDQVAGICLTILGGFALLACFLFAAVKTRKRPRK